MDISIKNLKKHVFEPKTESLRLARANEIVKSDMIVTEKVDGTKLTLLRTKNTDTDYSKNWIVAYKGTILSSKEFAHLDDKGLEAIKTDSVGIGQYALVFQHLKQINKNIKKIPADTEFSVEFAQNKDTLTRTYVNKGGMFLRSYGKVDFRVIAGELHTSVIGSEITEYSSVKKMADLLEISSFPVFHSGNLTKESLMKNPLFSGKMADVNWTDPIAVLTRFSEIALAIPSSLGGITEGVVMKLANGEFYKLVQADQYDAEVRNAKKELYKLDPESAGQYFQQIRSLIGRVFAAVGTSNKSDEDIISDANFYMAKNAASLKKFFESLKKIAGDKKNLVQINDDIHDTIRLLVSKRSLIGENSKTLALIPIAGKPLHIGHWKLIEKAANENDRVVVYTSSADRAKKGEFPIRGDDFVKFWADIFSPALPKNVKVKFVDSPVRSVMHELSWLEQTATQDGTNVPTVSLYSDKDDVDANFKDEDLKRYPTLSASGKIKKVGVDRTSTVNVSGTKMREFLAAGDKDSFVKNLPPVSTASKEKIWTTLLAHGQEKSLSEKIVEELVNSVEYDLFNEGGWRSQVTQKTIVTPKKVQAVVELFERFLKEFNAYSGLSAVKLAGPTGSASYYKQDLNDDAVTYGDVDMQIALPVSTDDREVQLKSNKLYFSKLREFLKTRSLPFIYNNLKDPKFGVEYLIFVVDKEKIQVDMVVSYKKTADWVKLRTTPEKGMKGFVTGMLLSALGDALDVSMSATASPHTDVSGKSHFFKHDVLFLDILKYFAKLAGARKINATPLKGYYGLDPTDPSFKKKCETVVRLADALHLNRIFASGVIKSKGGTVMKNRSQFIRHVLGKFIQSMELAKTAKKFDKIASTPKSMKNIEKVKAHADLGTEIAKRIIKEECRTVLIESGQSVAAVDAKTQKTVNGEPAKATTKLKIVGPDGKDIHTTVSADVKELIYRLNDKVGFWKKNSPYIENGFVFNGSSQFLMDPAKFGVLSKYKSAFGDIDVIVPKQKLDDLEKYLDNIDDNQVQWKPTIDNKISKNFYYVGRTKNARALAEQTVTLWYYVPMKQVVQIDFEGDDMVLDANGFEKPSEWIKFIKDSPWSDLESGIKGLAGAIVLRGLTRAATALPNAVYVTNKAAEAIEAGLTDGLYLKGKTDKKGNVTPGKSLVSVNASHSLPSQYTLNTSGAGHAGVRKAYRLVAKDVPYEGRKVDVYTDIPSSESKPEDRITSVPKIFELIFKRKPSSQDIQNFRSYKGLLSLMKTLPKNIQKTAMDRAKEGLEQSGLDEKDWAPIRKAAKEILGFDI